MEYQTKLHGNAEATKDSTYVCLTESINMMNEMENEEHNEIKIEENNEIENEENNEIESEENNEIESEENNEIESEENNEIENEEKNEIENEEKNEIENEEKNEIENNETEKEENNEIEKGEKRENDFSYYEIKNENNYTNLKEDKKNVEVKKDTKKLGQKEEQCIHTPYVSNYQNISFHTTPVINQLNIHTPKCMWFRDCGSLVPPKIIHPKKFSPLIADCKIVLRGGTIDSSLGERKIENYFLSRIPTDAQFQAHIMQYLKDNHNMTFDPVLNPLAPKPQYFTQNI